MPSVSAFRGISFALDRYASPTIPERVRLPGEPATHPGRLADVTDVACPPYDVISPPQGDALLNRNPHNAIRLELNPDPDPHGAAAVTLDAWLTEGVLERRAQPSVYYYAHARSTDPDDLDVQGVLCRVLLEPWGAGVRPHEHTMPGPKADRLALLRATRTQLSPILTVYFDSPDRYRQLMSLPWTDEWRARDTDGLLHQVVAIEADERLLAYLTSQTLYVADGHHRYETALAYQAEVRADPRFADAPPGSLAADWIMMVLVNAELEELEIRPTHRVLRETDPEAVRALVAELDLLFASFPMPPAELLAALNERVGDGAPAFALVLPGDEGFLLVGDPDAVDDRMRRERGSTAVHRLDLAVLHAAILGDRLGIDPALVAAGERLVYTRDAAEAVDTVARGDASAAFLVRPTPLDQLAAVASAGDVMPQKSTYFYPKLLTGMVFNPLED